MLTLTFLVKTLIELYVMVLLLRIWMQWSRCDFYNPLAQTVVKFTQPVIGPLRRIIPSIGPIDTSSLLVAFILSTLKFPLLLLIQSGGLSLDPFNLVEPLMAPIRRILPAMGGIDFSAMGVIILLYLLNYLGMDLFPRLWYLL